MHQGSPNPPISVLMARLRTERGGKCNRCPIRHGLEFAHVATTPLSGAGRGRGSRRRYLDIKKHPEAYELLCDSCHYAFDCKRAGEAAQGGREEEEAVPF